MKLCLLLGGESSERPVSLVSGAAVGKVCLELGHSVTFLDPAIGARESMAPGAADVIARNLEAMLAAWSELEPDPARIAASLQALPPLQPDVVLILLHGGAGEGGTVQAMLDLWRLPYAGSGHVASAVALDKVVAKRVLQAVGVPVAPELLWRGSLDGSLAAPSEAEIARLGGYPLVAKPIAGGSTLGVTLVRDASMWPAAWENAGEEIDAGRGLLVERFIPGKELTVGVLDDRALPVVEIRPHEGFYDYRSKYTAGQSEYIVPAEIAAADAERLQVWALSAFRAIGCRDVARVDFRLAPDGEVACLEVNTIPGMTPTSLVPKAARSLGIEFQDLVARLIERAAERGRAQKAAERGTRP